MSAVRQYSVVDRLIIGLEDLLAPRQPEKTGAARPNPADSVGEGPLDEGMRRHAGALMRVNHAGEVSAQALYQGQAVAARSREVRESMQQSASEEIDHLLWCRQRLAELGARTSYLDPLWYAGSFSLGLIAGLFGDEWSLGFVAETEQQVVRHLDGHLARLPEADLKSRAILEQMRIDESRHATVAIESGAAELPAAVKKLMALTSSVMTTTAYRI